MRGISMGSALLELILQWLIFPYKKYILLSTSHVLKPISFKLLFLLFMLLLLLQFLLLFLVGYALISPWLLPIWLGKMYRLFFWETLDRGKVGHVSQTIGNLQNWPEMVCSIRIVVGCGIPYLNYIYVAKL